MEDVPGISGEVIGFQIDPLAVTVQKICFYFTFVNCPAAAARKI